MSSTVLSLSTDNDSVSVGKKYLYRGGLGRGRRTKPSDFQLKDFRTVIPVNGHSSCRVAYPATKNTEKYRRYSPPSPLVNLHFFKHLSHVNSLAPVQIIDSVN